jgi:hypothetical protein
LNTKISSEVFDEYIKITLASDNTFAELKEILIAIRYLAEESNRKKILIDALNTPNVELMQRFQIGEMGVEFLGRQNKVAVIFNREFIDKFMETVAVNRGGQIRVVGSEPEALDWLLS